MAAVVSTGIADAIRIFLFAGIINSKKKRPPFLEAVCYLKIDAATQVRAAGFFAA
jgi:hypothetical protein